MLAEFIHSIVDCGNQSLLLIGLRDSNMAADRSHPYGYGKSIYFWALVSALGTFFLGAGVSMTHAVGDLMNPSLHQISWEVWAVLVLSFCIDGYVLKQTVAEVIESKREGDSYWKHIMKIRDPATLAVLLEDGAACLGIVIAIAGIAASQYTGNAIFDGIAGVGISTLLGVMGIALVRVNHSFLLGQAVDREIVEDIGKILLSRRSIDSIRSVQSQWTGPETFSYKAEVDFDGTYLAAKLMPIYQQEFIQIKNTMDDELQVLLALYAEDVMRTVEREVRQVEAQIRKKYPGAEYIELEPMSIDADRLAIDDNLEGELRRVESDALNRYLKSLKSEAASSRNEGESKSTDKSPRG
jgi:solute carrier family 30 (zinc transporter), member 9